MEIGNRMISLPSIFGNGLTMVKKDYKKLIADKNKMYPHMLPTIFKDSNRVGRKRIVDIANVMFYHIDNVACMDSSDIEKILLDK